jgi:hypothetical protein
LYFFVAETAISIFHLITWWNGIVRSLPLLLSNPLLSVFYLSVAHRTPICLVLSPCTPFLFGLIFFVLSLGTALWTRFMRDILPAFAANAFKAANLANVLDWRLNEFGGTVAYIGVVPIVLWK